jgi:hypothetical protein
MKPLIPPRYDPLGWCGLCFVVVAVGFWWPFLEANFGPDSRDSRIGIVVVFTGPFVLAAGIRSVFACRRLLTTEEPCKAPTALVATGFALTTGAVLPVLWLLFVLVSALMPR